jgi:hypothetical protein
MIRDAIFSGLATFNSKGASSYGLKNKIISLFLVNVNCQIMKNVHENRLYCLSFFPK